MSTLHKAGLGLALAGLALALSAPAALAQTTVFSNFGPGNTFGTSAYLSYGPTNPLAASNGTDSQGEGFTASASGNLSTINIALQHYSGTNDAHLFLANASGGVPGAILESFTITNLPIFGVSSSSLLITSTSHPLLTAGASYFLYEVETGNEAGAWSFNSIGETGPHLNSFNSQPYTNQTATQGAFSVQVGAPVPEASTTVSFSLLLALGLGGVIAGRRKKAEKSR